MDGLYTFGLVMLAISVTILWWRVCFSFALALLVAWVISKIASVNIAWLSYALLLGGPVVGVIWHRRANPVGVYVVKNVDGGLL